MGKIVLVVLLGLCLLISMVGCSPTDALTEPIYGIFYAYNGTAWNLVEGGNGNVYVPYMGADNDVDLGTHNLSAENITAIVIVAGEIAGALEGYSLDLVQAYINGVTENDTATLVFDFEPSKIVISYSARCHHANYPYEVGHTTGHSVITITGVDTITINTNYTAICDYDGVMDSAILHSNTNVIMAAGGYDGVTYAKCWGIGTWTTATHTLTITFNDVKNTWEASNFIEIVATAYR